MHATSLGPAVYAFYMLQEFIPVGSKEKRERRGNECGRESEHKDLRDSFLLR